mgnify:CR=1 FL=1
MSRRTPPRADGALYVRLPADAVDKLHRAAAALGLAKKDVIAGLVERYVDPDSRRGLQALGEVAAPRRGALEVADGSPTLGTYSFQPYAAPEPAEVLTPAGAAALLQLDEATVVALAEDGTLPGRRLGSAWRFSRAALLAWLASATAGAP